MMSFSLLIPRFIIDKPCIYLHLSRRIKCFPPIKHWQFYFILFYFWKVLFGIPRQKQSGGLCDCCSHLVMSRICWLSGESEGSHWFTRDVAWKHHASSSALLISCPSSGKPCVGCGRKKNLPFSSRMCASYTLNYPMMTLQRQHMPLWPQVPTAVSSSAISSQPQRASLAGPSSSQL